MEVLQTMSSGLIAAAAVFIVAWLGKERFDALFRAVDARFDAVDARFDAVDSELRELREDARQTRAEIASMRSDILNVALRTRPDAS